MDKYNLEDIININKIIGEKGTIINKSSLEYALSKINNEKLKSLSILIRAIIVDHPFIDGNKRTALAILLNEYDIDPDLAIKSIVKIAKKSINNIDKIEKIILNLIR